MWGAQSWVRFTKEVTYGVRNPSPGGTDVLWARLYNDNAFTMRPVVNRQIIRTADAGNRRRQVVHARTSLAGGLATLAYPSQMAYWWALCTLTSNDLPSCTIDFFDSTRVIGYLGAKIGSMAYGSSATQDYDTLGLQLTAQRVDATMTTLPQPADTVFPTEVPYEHVESAGNVTVGGSTLTKYSSLSWTLSNILGPTWDELAYITNLYYCGRDFDFSMVPQYLSTTWRTDFEAQSPLVCSLNWTRLGTAPHAMTIDLKSTNYIGSIADNIPLGAPTYQTVSVQDFFDTSTTTDFAITVT